MAVSTKELAGLYRTFYPKYAHYPSDGNGRDTYILKHNGGMCSEGTRPVFQTTQYTKVKPSVMGPSPLKEATSFKYVSDGSGRDFYITYNSGGLEAPYIPGTKKSDHNFILSLRSGLQTSQQKRLSTPSENQRMKKSRSAQRLLVRRLTATSQEWKQINKEEKRMSISRERDAMSPMGSSQQTQFGTYQMSRNARLMHPQEYNDKKINQTDQSSKQHGYPIYSRSTRNLLEPNKASQNLKVRSKLKQTHSNFMASGAGYQKTNNLGEAKLREQLIKNYRDLVDKTSPSNHPKSAKNRRISQGNMSSAQQFSNINQIEQLRSNILKRNKRRSSK
jgi:hypothetical protein